MLLSVILQSLCEIIPEPVLFISNKEFKTVFLNKKLKFKAGKMVTQATKRRTMNDFAQFMKILVTEKYSEAEVIRLVTNNLNAHKEKSFYKTFSEEKAKQALSKIEFHYTPKYVSWLNIAETQINVIDIEY